MEDCLFCKFVKGESQVEIIYENDNFMSFQDISQKVEGHSLVISKKHFETVLDMPGSLGSELIDCIKKTSLKLMKEYEATGFNVVQNNFKDAGQVVNHVHFHILPRKKGDKVGYVY